MCGYVLVEAFCSCPCFWNVSQKGSGPTIGISLHSFVYSVRIRLGIVDLNCRQRRHDAGKSLQTWRVEGVRWCHDERQLDPIGWVCPASAVFGQESRDTWEETQKKAVTPVLFSASGAVAAKNRFTHYGFALRTGMYQYGVDMHRYAYRYTCSVITVGVRGTEMAHVCKREVSREGKRERERDGKRWSFATHLIRFLHKLRLPIRGTYCREILSRDK